MSEEKKNLENWSIADIDHRDPLKGMLQVRFLNKYDLFNSGEIAWLPEKVARAISQGVRPAAKLLEPEKEPEKKSEKEPEKKSEKVQPEPVKKKKLFGNKKC